METMELSFVLVLLRFLTLGIGVIDVILVGHSYIPTNVDELVFFITILCCVVFSALLLFGYLSLMWIGTLRVKYVDLAFHIGSAVVLLITGIFMMAAALDRNTDVKSLTVERTIGALFGIQNALIYGIIAIILFRTVPSPPSKYGEGLEWEDPLIETIQAKKVDFGSITGRNR